MPADSEPRRSAGPDLPHSWRPLGALIVASALGLMLLALLIAVWIGLGDSVRSQFTPFQRITLVVLGLGFFACYHALVRSRVVAREEGLTVVNGYRKRAFEWSQVIAVQLRRGAPWATLDLSDGTSISLIGIQGSDGDRARRAVREIRATLAAHSPR